MYPIDRIEWMGWNPKIVFKGVGTIPVHQSQSSKDPTHKTVIRQQWGSTSKIYTYLKISDVLLKESKCFSGLWGLVNNAGIIGKPGRTDWQTLDDYRKVASINLFGSIDVATTFLQLIKKERRACCKYG